jgi:hypothetical protein
LLTVVLAIKTPCALLYAKPEGIVIVKAVPVVIVSKFTVVEEVVL